MKPIFIISGKQGSGKTTFLINVFNLLQKDGFEAAGFLALHEFKSDTYLIKDIQTNEESPLMQRVASFDQRPHHFKFFPKGVELGNNCINEILTQRPDIAIVDEIGGYELEGDLWSDGFTQLIESSVPLIFTTKSKLLERVLVKWEIKPTIIFHSADFGDPQKAIEQIQYFL